jgi:uncharacterized protein (DUF488 family)
VTGLRNPCAQLDLIWRGLMKATLGCDTNGNRIRKAGIMGILLQTYGIERIVDIRTIPRSRYNPQFDHTTLAASLSAVHLEYEHIQALGGLRHARRDSPNAGWRNKSFRDFADYMQTEAFADALQTLVQMRHRKRVAIMCAEAVPWRCHRSLVADALNVHGVPVVEILSESSYRMHVLTPFAQVEDKRITYPPEQAALL